MATWAIDNGAQSVAPGPITNSQLSLVLQSSATFASLAVGGSKAVLLVQDTGIGGVGVSKWELVLATGNNTGTNTITIDPAGRGYDGTTPQSFVAGATVTQVMSRAVLGGLFARIDSGAGTLRLNSMGASMGPPTLGTWLAGDFYLDSKGAQWACVAGGSPGTWVYIGGGLYHAEVYQAVSQSIPSSLLTQVAWDTVEADPNGNFTTGSNAHYTCPVAGRYLVTGTVSFGAITVSLTVTSIYKNGNDTKRGPAMGSNGGAGFWGPSFGAVIRCVAGDVLSVAVYQNSGSNTPTVVSPISDTHAQFTYLGT